MKTVNFIPQVLKWARERASLDIPTLAEWMKTSVDQVRLWEQTGEMTLSKAKKLAGYTHTPFGFLFLEKPLDDILPIPDFRTIKDEPLKRPSPDLLETIQIMQNRQEWMRDHLIEEFVDPLDFVGSTNTSQQPEEIALAIRKELDIAADWANGFPTWHDALRHLRERIESAGILVFCNGIVGNNTHRKLDPEEFRGFALCDKHAPLIFMNGADSKSAQMFTLAHELAHIWLGQDGVSNFENMISPEIGSERFCNMIAAEFLVPAREIDLHWNDANSNVEPFSYLSRFFKVSPIVAARRILDLGKITKSEYITFYERYIQIERKKPKTKGGDFWNTHNVRIDKRFGYAVVSSAKEGKILFQDAYRLTGISGQTFEKYAEKIGLPLR